MGCEGTNFKIILKNDYETIFNENNSDGKKIYNALRYKIKNSELRTHCIDYSWICLFDIKYNNFYFFINYIYDL